MELICLEDSWSSYEHAILVKKGSRYNLINVVKGKYRSGTNNNIWYELLETGTSIHHSSLFAVAPPIIEKTIDNAKIKEIKTEQHTG